MILKDLEVSKFKTADLYLPDGKNFPLIVFFHGGGLCSGDKADDCYQGLAEDFNAHGYAFASVNYRMYNEKAKYPDYLLDCADAVKYFKDKIKDFGGNGQIYVGGQSAGAWLSLMLCLNKTFLNDVGISPMEISGWLIDAAQTTAHFNVITNELKVDGRKELINEFAPLYYIDGSTEFTKIFLVFYENDMPCRPQQNELFYQSIKHFNPEADVTKICLKGTHCAGTTIKDDDGRYPFAKVALDWLNK